MNRTQRAETGLRPARPGETTAGQLWRTFPELDPRALRALTSEAIHPLPAIRGRAEDARSAAFSRLAELIHRSQELRRAQAGQDES